MRVIFLSLPFVVLMIGCTSSNNGAQSTSKPPISSAEPAKWLQTCVVELARNQKSREQWFSGMGANDVAFIPRFDPVDEIFRK